MENKFTNENRNRYYGLRIGDIIEVYSSRNTLWGRSEVLDFGFMDNNKVIIKSRSGKPIEWVAEWCKIITKVEDRDKKCKNCGRNLCNWPDENLVCDCDDDPRDTSDESTKDDMQPEINEPIE